MTFFTSLYGRSFRVFPIIVIWFGFTFISSLLPAQAESNETIPGPGQLNSPSTNTTTPPPNAASTNAPVAVTLPAVPPPAPNVAPLALTPAPAPPATAASPTMAGNPNSPAPGIPGWVVLGALMALATTGGFLLYQCGLTRAKNCGHTSALLLMGLVFGFIGYWVGGFAVQTGGVGGAHAALAEPILIAGTGALDHELGFMAFGHHWGLMGSAGFFLMTEHISTNGVAALFLGQAALLAIAVAAALGAALERGRLLAMAITAFVIGALIYPLFANWVWGGGWLAELGREYGLGHGFVDVAGAGVVHETAGTLALVIALVLGPRYGRFGRDKVSRAIPGHNVPFLILGSLILLMAWTAANALAGIDPITLSAPDAGSAAVNALLGAAAGMLISFLLAAWRKQGPAPALLCRGLLTGVVAVSACSSLIDPWAAFLIGAVAGWIATRVVALLERHRLDDPAGAIAIHGAGGIWGVLATGLFANGTAGLGMNSVAGPVRGLLFGGAWHQLAAQVIGAVTGFAVVFALGYVYLKLVRKILSLRVELVDEAGGLDWPQTGAFGYQGDIEPEDLPRN